MEIKRNLYLQRLINRIDNGMIKVITGIRRSGKSYLIFKIFKSYLLNNLTDKQHIIEFELDRIENKKYRKPDMILKEINSLIVDNKKYYILLDEIQMLEEFEKVLNSLLHKDNVDIYVTGSNSKFLSHDILTEFRGREDEIHLYPLSFKEYMSAYEGDKYQGWADLTSKGNKEKKQLEVDFIANLGSKRYYIQSALSLSTEEKVKQEKASLTNINDSFKKIILVKDVIKVKRDEDGIVTMNVYDFLLNDNSLEF